MLLGLNLSITRILTLPMPSLNLQSETVTFVRQVVAAGGTLSAATINAIDQFIVRTKTIGSWSLFKEVHPNVGDSLVAARQKLKYTTTATLTANNFVEADYSQETGWYLTANANKYIGTNFIPTTDGSLSKTNIFFGASLISSPADVYDYIISDDQPSGEDHAIFMHQRIIGVGSSTNNHDTLGTRVLSLSQTTNAWSVHLSGYPTNNTSKTPAGGEPDTQVIYYRAKRFGTVGYSRGGLGMVVFGAFLTETQARLTNLAIVEFEKAVGRTRWRGVPLKWFGDSITNGLSGGTYTYSSFSEIVSRAAGYRAANFGQSNTMLRQTGADASGLYASAAAAAGVEAGPLIVAIGTNDIAADPLKSTTGTSASISDFQTKFQSFLQTQIDACQPVLAAIGPFYRDPSVGSATCCRAYQVAAAAAANATTPPTPFIDGDRILRDLASPGSYLADTVHPNASGHSRYADFILAMLLRGEYIRELSVDFPSISAGATADISVEILGMPATAAVSVQMLSDAPPTGLRISAYNAGAASVTVRAENVSGSPVDASAFRVRIVAKR